MQYSFTAAALAVISTVSAHSWLECTNHDNSQILGWMQGNSTLNPPVIIDPGYAVVPFQPPFGSLTASQHAVVL
jgi:hypothetical protein